MKGFIELPDDKGNVHHFRYRDLNSYRDGYFHYEPQGGFCTLLLATEIKAIVEPSTPTPDALVEAVKVFLRHEICGGYEKPTWEKHSVRHLQDALAAHEKEKSHER